MVLLRILISTHLISSRTAPLSLSSISLSSICAFYHQSFLLTNGISSIATGDSKPTKKNSLSSIFTDPSPASQSRNHNDLKSEKWKIEEKDLHRICGSSGFQCLKTKKFPDELSPEAELLLKRLQEELYVMMEHGRMPAGLPSREMLKNAAEKIGLRHQEIAKWLSGSELKKIALFGCPSIERKTVFASKRLRSFFKIQEDIICRGCGLKTACKFANQRVSKVEKVILEDVMRLLTVLAFEAVPQQLVLSADVKLSVHKLLKEALNLSS